MKKQILVISASPRKGGNSEILADEFIKGAQSAGHSAEKICLYDKKIQFCRGCLACQKTHTCVLEDDAAAIVEKMTLADAVVFATPIYFYEMCGQMKTLLDRTNPAYGTDYQFRDIYLLAAAADADERSFDGAIQGLRGWIACFASARLAGVVKAAGADAKGAVRALPSVTRAAYEMGGAIR